jgi:hypothetical protein
MELTLERYELTLTIRQRRRKSRRENQLPVIGRAVAGPSTEHRLLLATGSSHIVPTR